MITPLAFSAVSLASRRASAGSIGRYLMHISTEGFLRNAPIVSFHRKSPPSGVSYGTSVAPPASYASPSAGFFHTPPRQNALPSAVLPTGLSAMTLRQSAPGVAPVPNFFAPAAITTRVSIRNRGPPSETISEYASLMSGFFSP